MAVMGYAVGPLLKRTGREILDDRIPTLAATTAYYFFFSLFPLLLFLTPILSLVGEREQTMAWLMAQLGRAMPPEAMAPLTAALREVVFSDDAPGLMSTGLLLAAWSGSNIFGALADALNLAYDVRETRPWWRRQLVRLGALVVAGAVFVLASAIILGGEDIAAALGGMLGLRSAVLTLWTVVQFPLAFALLVVLAASLFRILPNVRQRWPHVLFAAVVTTVLWLVVTLLFRAYVQNFGSYDKTYGTIGGIIALLTWMYYSMLVLLCGGELASELHHGTGALAPARGRTLFGRIVSHGAITPSHERVVRGGPRAPRRA